MDAFELERADPTFEADLAESERYVWMVARWLSARGLPVVVRPTVCRPDPSQRAQYADSGDLEIIHRVEVKHRPKLAFTGPEDYPYPTAIVDVAHSWDRARPKPYAYVIVNAPATVAMVILGSTHKKWKKVVRHARGRERTYYDCPVNLATFHSLGSAP